MKQITQFGASVEEALQLALQKLGVTRNQVEVEVLQEGKKGFLGFGAKQAEVRVTLLEDNKQNEATSVETKTEADKEVEEKNVESKFEVQENTTELNEVISEPEEVVNEDLTTTNDESTENIQHEVDPTEKAKQYIHNIAKEMGVNDLIIHTETENKRLIFKLESEKAALLIGKHGATLNAIQQLTQIVINNTAKTFISVMLDVENYRERRQVTLEQLADRMADKAVRTGRKVVLEPMPSYERKVIHNALANRIDIETYSEGVEPNRYLVIEPLK